MGETWIGIRMIVSTRFPRLTDVMGYLDDYGWSRWMDECWHDASRSKEREKDDSSNKDTCLIDETGMDYFQHRSVLEV
jgi:hypothetical protein